MTSNGRALAELEAPEIQPGDPASLAIQAALGRGVLRMKATDASARRGEVTGVHRLRTSTRRLRSELRLFRDLLGADWAGPIEAELKWLAGLLGAVRDLDVLQERLGSASAPFRDALDPLFGTLAARHTLASEALHEALDGDRYPRLLERLEESAEHPVFQDGADAPCRSALPPLVAETWKALRGRARALDESQPDEAFHDVRKRAKRARYAAETVAVALDEDEAKEAKHFAKLATAVQDILGEHQDAAVSVQVIERIVAEHPADGHFAFAAGRLLERQAVAAEHSRNEFFGVWARLDRKKVRRWFHS